MLKKSQIKLNHLQYFGLMVFGILSLNHHGYTQKRISSGGNVTIEKHMKIKFDRTKVVTLPKRSMVTQEVTVALNDGVPEYWNNPRQFFGDAKGDGMIDQGDVLPIGFNWGRIHTAVSLLTGDETASGELQGLMSSKLILGINGDTHPDQEFWVEVRAEEVEDLFGIAFDVVYAPTTYVDPQTVEPGTWMGNDVIFYPNIDKNNGRISIGITRKAGQTNVDGSGMVARIKMKMLASASIGDVTNLTLENVAAIDSSANAVTFSVMNESIVTSIEGRETVEIPFVFELAQNFPNPFNSETHIGYDLPTLTRVRIDIFNMLGRKIRTLVDEEKPAGSFHVVWDGKMDNGQEAASGVYIYFMKTKAYTRHRKLLLMR